MTSQWGSHSGNVYDNVQDLPKKFKKHYDLTVGT